MKAFYKIVFLLLILGACKTDPIGTNVPDGSAVVNPSDDVCSIEDGWSIPPKYIVDSGSGNGGIPSINEPKFVLASSVVDIEPDELVIVVSIDGETKIYPHRILDFHEVVNDQIGDNKITVSFCPLTGTTVGWYRLIDGNESKFSVSGLLYNANLIVEDDFSRTKWSQVLSIGINGAEVCNSLSRIPAIELPWQKALDYFPEAKVLSFSTGFSFNYLQTPLSYNQPLDASTLIPVIHEDQRLPNYQRVGILVIDQKAKAYNLAEFNSGQFTLVLDRFNNEDVLIIANPSIQYFNAFKILGQDNYTMLWRNNVPFIHSGKGDVIDLLGNVIEGPNSGTKLVYSNTVVGYWFALASFYPGVEIFNNSELGG